MALSNNSKYDHLVKLLLIGDSGVGKSCLLLRYCDDAFAESFISTIGIDFKVRTVEIGGKRVRAQIWDTAGQERFQNILPAYYRNAHGIALVFDVTDEKSFDNVSHWIESIDRHSQSSIELILIANKTDMSAERVISTEQATELAKKYSVPLFETSAKSNANVAVAIETLIKSIITKPQHPPAQPLQNIKGPNTCSSCAK
jgi:Ras-related protein Rab-8A